MMGMLWKKGRSRCHECNASTEEDWAFCPRCGSSQKENDEEQGFGVIGDIFGQMEKQMQQQMQDMDRLFGETVFAKPKVVMPRGGSGISISINNSQGGAPKVTVHTFGNARKLEPQVRQQLKVGPAAARVEKEDIPRITEEPETEVRTEGKGMVYMINLPDVRKAQDIQVNRLPNSIEVRAKAGGKMYFKLFEAPPNLSIAEKNFSNGKLTLVLKQE